MAAITSTVVRFPTIPKQKRSVPRMKMILPPRSLSGLYFSANGGENELGPLVSLISSRISALWSVFVEE
jgi:hypothetical protein